MHGRIVGFGVCGFVRHLSGFWFGIKQTPDLCDSVTTDTVMYTVALAPLPDCLFSDPKPLCQNPGRFITLLNWDQLQNTASVIRRNIPLARHLPFHVKNRMEENGTPLTFPAADGYVLHGVLFSAMPHANVLIVNSATAVPQRFYRRFAKHMQAKGLSVLTFDYRGIGLSAPSTLRGFEAHVSDWGLKDIQGAIDFVETTLAPRKIFLMGHSAGGQQAGLITCPDRIAAMATVSAQSGYWRLQGGWEKPKAWLLTTILIPLLTRACGYFPWKAMGAENLPYHIALEWASWCRQPNYLHDDKSLPLERFDAFKAPVLAYSIDDDDWGTLAAVQAMMSAYPKVSFEHLVPQDHGIERLGHLGFFRKGSEALWDRVHGWLERAAK